MNDLSNEIQVVYGDRVLSFPRNVWGPGAVHANHEKPAFVREALQNGKFIVGWNPGLRDHIYADDREARRLRALVLGTTLRVPDLVDMRTKPIRAYVPGLWNHGTVPAFIAPKGFGKTWIMAQLAASLIIPGARFLDFFEPAEMNKEERARNVILLNPETEPGAIDDVLIRAGLEPIREGTPVYRAPGTGEENGLLIVEHLLEYDGGATTFDLSDEAKADGVTELLTARSSAPPLTVLADGITAMIGNDTSRTGRFASELMRTLTQAGIPNGFGVLHSPMNPNVDTPMRGLESWGQFHGGLFGSASAFPVRPNTRRTLYSVPRIGSPEVPERRLLLGLDMLWRLQPMDGGEAIKGPSFGPDLEKEKTIIDKLVAARPEKLWTRDLCPTDDYKGWKQALSDLEKRGEVVSEFRQKGRSRGYVFGLSNDDDD